MSPFALVLHAGLPDLRERLSLKLQALFEHPDPDEAVRMARELDAMRLHVRRLADELERGNR